MSGLLRTLKAHRTVLKAVFFGRVHTVGDSRTGVQLLWALDQKLLALLSPMNLCNKILNTEPCGPMTHVQNSGLT